MRPLGSTGSRSVPLILGLLALAGCGGKWTLDPLPSEYFAGTNCDPGGARVDLPESFHPLDFAVGQVQILMATLDGPQLPCPGRGSEFVRLEWIADSSALEPQMQVRLVSCEACSVLFEGLPVPDQRGVKGAAVLHRSRQRLAFEVLGRAPGLPTLHLFACMDESCGSAAIDHLSFRVVDP